MRRAYYYLLFFLLSYAQVAMSLSVLLDPGHGGEDKGAVAKITLRGKHKIIYEKDLTLAITKRVFKILRKNYSVYLTRSIDRTIPLIQRASLAEKMQADLLVSIHINSSKKRAANGMEMYYLDNHQDKAVARIEELENFSDKTQKRDPIQHILTDLIIERTVETSKELGRYVHREIAKVGKRFKMKDRGIKPGMFYVLLLANRPGLLIEVGFMSNPIELKKLLSPTFQQQYAQAIARGISRYIDHVIGAPPLSLL